MTLATFTSTPVGASRKKLFPNRGLVAVFAATIFTSAFLLFEVQPIISRFILPWHGGSPAVWTTSMVFFQTVLFLGYLYADLAPGTFPPGPRGRCTAW